MKTSTIFSCLCLPLFVASIAAGCRLPNKQLTTTQMPQIARGADPIQQVASEEPRLYVDDKEFELILESLKREARKFTGRFGDYVADEDLDAILPLLSDDFKTTQQNKPKELRSTRPPSKKPVAVAEPDELDLLAPEQMNADADRRPLLATRSPPRQDENPPASDSLAGDARAFVSDKDFDKVLAKLREEAERNLENSGNYVSEKEFEEILLKLKKQSDSEDSENRAKESEERNVNEKAEAKRESPPEFTEHVEKSNTCKICNKPFGGEETLQAPSCAHVFHQRCLNGWFRHQVSVGV